MLLNFGEKKRNFELR